jgi:hypothetical protein
VEGFCVNDNELLASIKCRCGTASFTRPALWTSNGRDVTCLLTAPGNRPANHGAYVPQPMALRKISAAVPLNKWRREERKRLMVLAVSACRKVAGSIPDGVIGIFH